MNAREFDVIISPDGTVEVQVRGIKGRGCIEVAKWFEEVVGELQSRELTSEFYDPEEQVQYRIDQRH
jgi:hypothetical protein